MKKHSEKDGERRKNRIRLIQSISMVIVAALLLGGVTRAWFVKRSDITTLVDIEAPTDISLLGPHGSVIQQLDLSYTDEDKKGDTVTIRRVISVSSDQANHELEIVHTTNMKNLTFQVYPATESDSISGNGTGTSDTPGNISSGGYKYTYKTNTPLGGKYLNQDRSDSEYKYADNSKHLENYGTYENVQNHAEPLYWLVQTKDSDNKDTPKLIATANTDKKAVNTNYLTYYVLEISWQETTKETDVFYVLARNA